MSSLMIRPSTPSISKIPTSVGLSSNQDGDCTVRFADIQDLFQAINRVSGDILIVIGVSPSQFLEIEKHRRNFRFRRYHADTHILVITIPTPLHEALHLQLYEAYRDQLVRQGKQGTWSSRGTATFRPSGHHGGDGGEGDSTGGPDPERVGEGTWPTLIIEAGDSESLNGLRADMRWWFSASDHDVKIVLLAKFNHTLHEITLERWEEETPTTRPGAMTTRWAATQVPVLQQSITISRNQATDPVSYNVISGALVLGFRLLHLRDPGLQEGDYVISVLGLQEYAARVWRLVRD